jgi:hypothetical protein
MDSNCHSSLWGSPDTDPRGSWLEMLLFAQGLVVLNVGNTNMYITRGERTCPDTPNRKYPDIVPKGNIPTKLHNRKYPDSKKGCRDISCWATGNVPTQFLPTGNVPTAKKHCRDICCCPTGNIPTAKILSGYFLLANGKCSDTLLQSSHTIDQFWID